MRIMLKHFAITAAMLVAGCGAAFAQSTASYPNKPVRVLVTFPPGGSVDVVPRIVAQKLIERWGQPWVFDNRPGAGGQIAVDAVLKSPADGYTLLVGPSGAIGSIQPVQEARPTRYDLAPIVPPPRRPWYWWCQTWSGTVKDWIEQSRSARAVELRPRGNGTGTHLTAKCLMVTGADLTPVPFRPAAPSSLLRLAASRTWLVDSNFALIGTAGDTCAPSRWPKDCTPVCPMYPRSGRGSASMRWAVGRAGGNARGHHPAAERRSEHRARDPDVQRILATGNEPWSSTPEVHVFVRSRSPSGPKWSSNRARARLTRSERLNKLIRTPGEIRMEKLIGLPPFFCARS
jgi:hypothetical protein